MFRSLLNDLVTRRLWPIPLAAVLVAIAVPLLFMKSDDGAPAVVTPTPAAVGADKLPDGAGDLLSTKEREVDSRRRNTDPFDVPPSVKSASEKTAAATAAPAASTKAVAAGADKAVLELVDKLKPDTGSSAKQVATAKPKSTNVVSPEKRPAAKPKKKTATPKRTPVKSNSIRLASVDIRYGKSKDAPMSRTIPERKVLQADGEAVAVFIRYSKSRNKAVFAVAPGVKVTGSVNCKKVDGVCRYVAIPDGGYARLSYTRGDGTRVVRRLDVAINKIVASSKPELSPERAKQGQCVLDKLLNLPAGSLALPLDRCAA